MKYCGLNVRLPHESPLYVFDKISRKVARLIDTERLPSKSITVRIFDFIYISKATSSNMTNKLH